MAVRCPATVFVLPQGADEGPHDPFVEREIKLDVQKDSASAVLERVDVRRGFLCVGGRVADESTAAKQWFYPHEPLIAVAVRSDYIESDESRQRHPAARLVEAGVAPIHMLRALSRAAWHVGFSDFARSALEARRLI
eukprot:Hpha_TRINITY_DN12239_c0_g1::TRINITY_DN12239_c0_g1_i2::g.16647::m.16647